MNLNMQESACELDTLRCANFGIGYHHDSGIEMRFNRWDRIGKVMLDL